MGKFSRYITSDGGAAAIAVDCADIFKVAAWYVPESDLPLMSETLAAAAVMGCMLKSERQGLTLRYTAADRVCVAVSDFARREQAGEAAATVHVKGYAADGGDKSPSLAVIKDLGLKEPHVAVVPLAGDNFCENVTAYYHVSEQVRSVFSHIGDTYFLVQLLPGAADNNTEVVETIIGNLKSAQTVTDIFSGLPYELLDVGEAVYKCDCSRERTEKMLSSLGETELQKLREEQNGVPIEVRCHFCDRVYRF
ncbi:33 kDa chaperonin [Clostridia bacterium]|nr:33 kDa chaperonin [Clostridia bacterium]